MTAHPRRRLPMQLDLPDDPLGRGGPKLLIVGESVENADCPVKWSTVDGTMAIAYSDFTVASLRRLDPDFVLVSLVSYSFDCTDVARTLVDGEFTGRMRVLCKPLPKPELVSEELRATFPSLDIELWLVPQT